MSVFLKLRPYQLFIVLMLPNILAYIPAVKTAIPVVWGLIFISWIYTIAFTMNRIMPSRLKQNLFYFKLCCIFLMIGFLGLSAMAYVYGNEFGEAEQASGVPIIVFLLAFFGSFVYAVGIAAELVAIVINGDRVNFTKWFPAFLSILMYPIGIWYLQPLIRKIQEKYSV